MGRPGGVSLGRSGEGIKGGRVCHCRFETCGGDGVRGGGYEGGGRS